MGGLKKFPNKMNGPRWTQTQTEIEIPDVAENKYFKDKWRGYNHWILL